MLTHVSLFSGIGGIDIAAHQAGFKTVCFVEIDPFCQKILNKHWPNVPIIGDIRDVKGTEFGAVTLVTGGFPCQPFSQAGKRRGKEDDRYLWGEMFRVIRELKPTWVVAENVAGIINMELDNCLSDLVHEGFEIQTFLIPACAVNAPHRRDRIFIVGYSKHARLHEPEVGSSIGKGELQECSIESSIRQGSPPMADTAGEGLQNRRRSSLGEHRRKKPEPNGCNSTFRELQDGAGIRTLSGWWATEPELGRVANGIPNRVDRLKCLGNAVVPQQIYPILKTIANIENSLDSSSF